MDKVFDTAFETSLRVLLTLDAATGNAYTIDRIAAADFLTVYNHEFGLSNSNLHGENVFRFSEYTLRRELVSKAIKYLVLKGFIDVSRGEDGFHYSINQTGKIYCQKLDDDYATSYRHASQRARAYMADKPEQDVLKTISQHSISALRRGE